MKLIRTTLIAAALCVAVAGCGNDDELTDVTSQLGSTSSESSTEAQQSDGLNRASGQVAEVAGRTAQVQGDGTQVAVTWNGATTFTADQTGTVADVAVGACVMVSTSSDSSDSSDAGESVTATTVRVLSMDGDCAMPGGMGGPGGSTGPGAGERPTDLPTDLPSDLPQPGDGQAPDGQRPSGGRGQFGEVTALSKDGFTLTSSMPNANGGADGADSADGGTTARQVTVTLTKQTAITVTVDATASAVTAGTCLQASGERSSTGTLTATTVAISQPVDGVCERGFGGRRPGADDEDAS